MAFSITITKSTVVLRRNLRDMVFLDTLFPKACYPFDEKLQVSFFATKGTGADYVKKHFGIESEIVSYEEDYINRDRD